MWYPRAFLIRKAVKNAKKINISAIISYLKSQYSADHRDQITFIQNFPSQRDVPSFDEISKELKAISKSMKENENMSLKNKYLFGGWLSIAEKAYRRDKFIKGKNLPQRFNDWIYRVWDKKAHNL